MYRSLSKLSKLAMATAVAAGAFIWSAPSTTYALSIPALDKGLQVEIREELGLSSKEPVTLDEVAILTSLVIDEGSNITSLQGLEEALFLHSVIINGSHANLDISALKEVPELSLLVIDPDRLSDAGQKILGELEEQGVNLVKIDDDSTDSPAQNSIQVYLNGELMDFEMDPVIKNGSTMVQFRPLFEAFGLQVGWDQATKKVTGTKEKLKIELTINSKTATVSGRSMTLAAAPALITGNTMVPLRFIGEATGRRVIWDAETRTIFIDSTETSANLEVLYSNQTYYTGDKQNGVPHGKGTLRYMNRVLYEGDFVNGVLEGSGIFYNIFDRNTYYEGEFKNNRYHGKGKQVSNIASMEGTYVDGLLEGSGKATYPDGSLLYIGEFSLGEMSGHGTYYIDGRTYYVGEFKKNIPEGQGKVYFDGKLNFEGSFQFSSRYYGKSYIKGKLDYEGYFDDNMAHGYGTSYMDDGTKYYRGQFKDSMPIGVGIYYLDNGDRYIGEVYNNMMDGFGFVKGKDGVTVSQVGYWLEDEFIGENPPPESDETRIKLLSRHADYSYVDGMNINEYDLDRNEAMMFIELWNPDDLELFNNLSKEAKTTFVNSFVQDRWGDVLGVDNCYVYVMFDDKVYAEATISYEMADGAVVLKEYPRGNGTINE